jgi:hypothetical protein
MMFFKRFVAIVFALGLTLCLGLPVLAASADTAAVMAPLQQFMHGVSTNDMKLAAAACASPASILDDFPPHIWQGPTACADWATAFTAANKQAGVTAPRVTLGKPWTTSVTGDRAYAVVPATFTYLLHGKPSSETGVWTVVLDKAAPGWRIRAWAWAQHP